MNTAQTSLFDAPVRKQPQGNTQLVEYGILQEQSDYRVHVGYLAQRIFLFPTREVQQLIYQIRKNKELREIPITHPVRREIVTAVGFAVPIGRIPGMQQIIIPYDIHQRFPIQRYESTSLSGQKAVKIVIEMIRRNLIALPIKVTDVKDVNMQIFGSADIILYMNYKLQVKSDWMAGDRTMHQDCRGNLFLQIAECNPDKSH